jgi:hypothetical protein
MTERIQYYMSDLADKLGIGDIKEIHISDVGERPVLRIECDSLESGGYKTIKSTPQQRKSKSSREPAKRSTVQEPQTFTEKLAIGAKDFFLNPERNKGKNW